MRKTILSLLCMVLVIFSVGDGRVFAETKSTTVTYSAPATVTYKDYDGSSTVQEVEVGSYLKEPEPKGKDGCKFLGWKDEKTGEYWDFSKPVTDSLTLVATYSDATPPVDPDPNSHPSDSHHNTNSHHSSDTSHQSHQHSGKTHLATATGSVTTGDRSMLFLYVIVLLAAGIGLAVLFYRKRNRRS